MVVSEPLLVWLLSMTTGSGFDFMIRRRVSRPSMTGISTSNVTTSTSSLSSFSRASCPFLAKPATSSSGSALMISVISLRIKALSSTTKTLIGIISPSNLYGLFTDSCDSYHPCVNKKAHFAPVTSRNILTDDCNAVFREVFCDCFDVLLPYAGTVGI